MKNYSNNENIPIDILIPEVLELCEKIGMPEEAAKQVISKLDGMHQLYPELIRLTSIDTGEDAYNKIKETCGEDDICVLAAQLTAAGITKRMFADKGYDLQVFYETMHCFSLYVKEHIESFGRIGYDRGWWVWRQLSCTIFKLGTLEFETEVLCGYDYAGAKDGDTVISVHIPSDAVLSRENLDDSYRMAREFFARHDIKYSAAYCATWLLSPLLLEFLKEGSRILEFQKDYEIFGTNPDDRSYFNWVFKREYPDWNDLPEDTSLQRNIKKHILGGGKISSGSGLLRNKYFCGL